MIGMQSTLDRILSTVSGCPPQSLSYPPVLPPGHITQPSPGVGFGQGLPSPRTQFPSSGFAAPVREITLVANGPFILSQPHKYATYGIVTNTAASDGENDSEDALPGSALTAPIEALQGLANAAVEAANAPELSPKYVGVYITMTSRLPQS